MSTHPPDDSTPGEAELARAAHQNLLDYQARAAEWMPGGEAVAEHGLLLVRADLPFPAFRSALRAAPLADPPAAIAAAHRRLGSRVDGDGFNLMARESVDDDLAVAAIDAGAFEYGTGAPEMVCAARLPDAPEPGDAVIRRVDDAAGVHAYAEVAGRSFASLGWPSEQITASFADVASLLRDDVFMFVASVDREPVAAAMTVLTPGGGAYISWVSTLEAARGRGLGEAVTRSATNAGFDAGAAFASLEASPMGEPIYARMGFETLYRYRFVITLAT